MTKISRLPNGITIVCEEKPAAYKVAMSISSQTGAKFETPETEGLTGLMQEAALAGTKTRTRDQVAEEAAALGVTIGAGADYDLVSLTSQPALKRFAPDVFALMADVFVNAVFADTEIEKVKTLALQSIRERESEPEYVASIKYEETAYGRKLDSEGSEKTIASFTAEQVRQKYADMLAHPEKIIVSFAGPVTMEEAEALVKKHLGGLAPASTPAPSAPALSFRAGDYRDANDTDQMWLHLGFEAPSRNSPEKYTYMMLQQLIAGGMSAPLFQEVREKRSLAYSPHAYYRSYDTTGSFSVMTDSTRGNIGEVLSIVADILGKIIREGASQQALDERRMRILHGLRGQREKVSGLRGTNERMLTAYGRLVTIEETEVNLKRVTPDDIRHACIKMLSGGNYVLSAVGPQDTMPTKDELKALLEKQVQGLQQLPAPAAKTFVQGAFAGAQAVEIAEQAPKMTTLKNGIRVVTVERPGNLSCGAWVGVGSDNETPDLNGSTHVMEHMMFKGTRSFGRGEISALVEGKLGGGLNAYTSNDRTAYFYYDLDASALETLVNVCGEMIFHATYDEAEYEGKMLPQPDGTLKQAKGERDVVINELNNGASNPIQAAYYNLMAAAYPDQVHGRSVIGTKERLRKQTMQQLRDYRDRFYVPNNVVFCASGPVKHEDFVAFVEKQWGGLTPDWNVPKLPPAEYKGGSVAVNELETAKTCAVLLAAEGPASGSDDSYAYNLLAQILSAGPSSRLKKEIVYGGQLASDVDAFNYDFINGGIFMVHANADAENVKPLAAAVYDILRTVASAVTEEELAAAKLRLEGSLLGTETNQDMVDKYGCDVLVGGKPVTPAEQLKKMQAVTLDDIKRVTANILACKPTASIVTPTGTDKSLLPKQAELVAMRDGKQPAPTPKKAPKGPTAG